MNFLALACLALNTVAYPHNNRSNATSGKSSVELEGKPFKVQSLPFDINALHLQLQYIVKIDTYAEQKDYGTGKPEKKVLVLDKKLVDLKRHVVVLDFPMLSDDIKPTIRLSSIDKREYCADNFDDVNFDGYKDIREPCIPCSGSLGNIETVFLFDHRTKRFTEWKTGPDINIELDPENKIVRSYAGPRNEHGQFYNLEIKFGSHGAELYREELRCTFLNEKKRLFKAVYNKYNGKKRVIHRTRTFTSQEDPESSEEIKALTSEK